MKVLEWVVPVFLAVIVFIVLLAAAPIVFAGMVIWFGCQLFFDKDGSQFCTRFE